MLIAIDGNEANIENKVGSNQFAFQILHQLWEIRNKAGRTKFKDLNFAVYLKNKPLKDMPRQKKWWRYHVLKPGFLWTQWRLPLELLLHKNKIDVFFSPGHYGPRFCPCPLVISIMDLAFLRFSEHFKNKDIFTLKKWTRYSVQQAEHIVTISKFSKKEIIYFYKVDENKISVIYPSIPGRNNDFDRSSEDKILNNYQLQSKKYFLYLGTLQPRKNIIRLIKAFQMFITHYSSAVNKLVIAGKKGWMYEDIFKKVEELGMSDKIIFTGYITDKEKKVFLKKAFSYILPSLYEGFGIPVLEAMEMGCPVIVSKNSSLPEVVGKAGVFIKNPKSVSSISKAMEKMVKLTIEQRKKMIKKGYRQVKKFSWEKSAQKILKILVKKVEN